MDAIEMIQERRSVRKYKDEKVVRKKMEEIIEIARWAPSWANTQIARYTLVDDAETIARLAAEGVQGFSYNLNTLKRARGVAVLSFVKGKSGRLEKYGDFDSSNPHFWEAFDAGIACQTFCLAAHAKGIGTCIFGVIDDESISQIVGLPEEETVAALIVYGYPDEKPAPTPRKPVEEILRYL
ncbi:nitroreductase [Desulfuromonas versatilis]|uniref:Nitroreductase n=1 Tax=Desulfuromonas versatilis TaxID=2802975 RepID=A0ABM8HWH1_9BACT|nr:nitroreductase family protein [Desulfuromonas versatilis]BCR06288.1 nitroreductase [Desulfuromonas versatilis]